MKKLLLSAAILVSSAAPAAADGIPDTLPPLPAETGEEICYGKLDACKAGLESCQQDRATALGLLNECLGLPADASLDEAKKAAKPPKKAKKRIVRKKRTPPKPAEKPAPKAGPQGPAGKDGADGKDGSNGHSVVWSIRDMPRGKTCPAGGYLYMTGLDADDDGDLDPTEAAELMAICHGRDGKDGKDGRDGDDGVRPTVAVGTFANALYAHNRPNSYAVFATASLGWPLNDAVSLTLEGGAAPGLDAAMMLRVGLDWQAWDTGGFKLGGLYEVVGLVDNNYANDQFVLVTLGAYKDLSLYEGESTKLDLRGELVGLIGADAFINADRKNRKAYGAGGGLSLRLAF